VAQHASSTIPNENKAGRMKLTKKEAALLSDRERALLESKGPWQVKPLAQSIKRVRELRDRAADLLQRQTIANRQGSGSKRVAAPNARSGDKLAVLDKALAQLRQALEAIDAESSQAIAELRGAERASRASRAAAKKAVGGRTPKASAAVATPARKAAAKSAGKTAASGSGAMASKAVKSTPTKPARSKAPVKAISSKARAPIVRSLPGSGSAPPSGAASRRTRAKKSRKG